MARWHCTVFYSPSHMAFSVLVTLTRTRAHPCPVAPRSCSAPLAFSKGLAPRVARSGSVQVVQSLRIIPPSMHPRAALCAGAMSRVSEVLYLPLFDSSRAGHGPVAVLEAFMSVRSVAPCQPADLISYVASAASDLGMSVHTPEAEEPVEAMSMLRGRRARPSHDAASSRDAAPWGAARQCSDGLSEATERQPQLSSATQPHLSTAAPPRLSSATQPHLSTATQPHLSSATQPHLSSAALPHLSSAPQPHLSTAAPAAAGTSHAMAGTSSTAEQGHAFRTPGLATMAGAPRPATCAHPCTITQPHGVGSGSGGRSGGVNVGGAAGFGGSLMASSSTPLDGALHANCMVSVDHEMASSAPYHAFVMSGAGRRTFCSGGGDVVAVRGAAHRRSLGARPMSGMVRSQSMFRMPAPDEPAPGCGCDMGVDVAMAASVMQNSGRLSALGESTAC